MGRALWERKKEEDSQKERMKEGHIGRSVVGRRGVGVGSGVDVGREIGVSSGTKAARTPLGEMRERWRERAVIGG